MKSLFADHEFSIILVIPWSKPCHLHRVVFYQAPYSISPLLLILFHRLQTVWCWTDCRILKLVLWNLCWGCWQVTITHSSFCPELSLHSTTNNFQLMQVLIYLIFFFQWSCFGRCPKLFLVCQSEQSPAVKTSGMCHKPCYCQIQCTHYLDLSTLCSVQVSTGTKKASEVSKQLQLLCVCV